MERPSDIPLRRLRHHGHTNNIRCKLYIISSNNDAIIESVDSISKDERIKFVGFDDYNSFD